MKKSLIALAVGAAFAAPAAYADVTLSGSINMGIEVIKGKEGTAPGSSNSIVSSQASPTGGTVDSATNTGVASNYSNVTIGSMEDLGGGLKLDFAFQMVMRGGTNEAVNGRNSHIGLVGDSWGGFWYGINENIYERYLYSTDPLDGAAGLGGNLAIFGNPGAARVFSDSHNSPALTCTGGANIGNGTGVSDAGKCAEFYRRDEQTLWYDSPNWGGFTFGAALGTNYDKNDVFKHNPSQYQIGAKYVGPSIPLEVWGAFAEHKDYFGLLEITNNTFSGATTSPSSKDKAYQLGGAYTLGDIRLFVLFEQLKYEIDQSALAAGDVSEYKVKHYGFGLKWNVATGYVGAQYLKASDGTCTSIGVNCDAKDTGASQVSLGYYHTMSKQTQVYVVGAYLNNKDLARYRTSGIGNPNMGTPGADFTSVGVGIKHSF